MENIKFVAYSESEYVTIMSWLEEFEVPYQVKMLQNPLYPSLNILQPIAEFFVPEENAKDLSEFLLSRNENTALQESLEEVNKKTEIAVEVKKKKNLKMLALGIYALIASIIALRYYFKEQRFTIDKNYSQYWNYDLTELTMKHKKNKQLSLILYDSNLDSNFERVEEYTNGKLYAVESDFDEDGLPDSKIFYSQPNVYSGCIKYINKDQYIDYQEIILQSGDTLHLTDVDQNGIMEMK